MGYAEKKLIRMTLPLYDFGGSGSEIMSFYLPRDEDGSAMQGRLVNVGVMATEVFATSTLNGTVDVGTAADDDAFATLTIPTGTADKACADIGVDPDVIISKNIPSGTLVQVTTTVGTDVSAVTGQGVPFIDMYVW